jgi:hypothetical protein
MHTENAPSYLVWRFWGASGKRCAQCLGEHKQHRGGGRFDARFALSEKETKLGRGNDARHQLLLTLGLSQGFTPSVLWNLPVCGRARSLLFKGDVRDVKMRCVWRSTDDVVMLDESPKYSYPMEHGPHFSCAWQTPIQYSYSHSVEIGVAIFREGDVQVTAFWLCDRIFCLSLRLDQ